MKDSKKLRPLSDARREYNKMKLRPENKKEVEKLAKKRMEMTYEWKDWSGGRNSLTETIQNDRKADEALTRDIQRFGWMVALGIGFFLGVILTVSIMASR